MSRLLFSCCLLLLGFSASGQEHFYDFIVRGQGSSPRVHFANNEYVLFTANTPKTGAALYVTDGTKKGTQILREFEGSNPGFKHFTEFAGKTFFIAYTTKGTQIWHTDGTAKGTEMYFQSSAINGNREIDLLPFNDWLFYQNQISEDSFYVMRVDTTLKKQEIVARHAHGHEYAKSNFVATDNYLFYGFNDQIYRLDKNFSNLAKYFERSATAVGDVAYLYEHNNTVIWYMRESGLRTMVYAGGETIGTHKEVERLYGYIFFQDHAVLGKYFYYIGSQYGSGDQVYRLNTQNLTQEDVGSTAEPYVGQQSQEVEVYKGQVYFQGLVSSDKELWKTGNSNSTTVRVSNIAADTSSRPQRLTVVDDKLYFSAYTRTGGRELWVTEGTTATTRQVIDLMKGAESSDMGLSSVAFKNKLVTAAYNHQYGMELWITDGTEAGTELLMDLNTEIDYGNQQVGTFMHAGDYMYIFANDSVSGRELWRTDGTREGTIFLDNINIAHLPSDMSEHIEYKGQLYGTAFSFAEGLELYTSNGTPAGSDFVTPSDLFNSSAPGNYVIDGTYFYFIGSRGFSGGPAIFRSNGTKAGTKPYLATGNQFNGVSHLTRVGNWLVAGIDDDTYGNEPYIVDVANGKIELINDDATSTASSDPKFFCGTVDTLLYISKNAKGWPYINYAFGSAMSNRAAAQLEGLELKGEYPDTLFRAEKHYYMVAETKKNEHRVFGILAARGIVSGFDPKTSYRNVESIANLGDRAIFSALHSSLGQELFITDGTDSGTVLLADINPGSGSSNPDHFHVYKGHIVFSATTSTHGREVWITDGTAKGTRLLSDIYEGTGSSNPTAFSGYQGYVYISASDSVRSNSLYRAVIDSCDILAPQLTSGSTFNTICEGQSIKLFGSSGPANAIGWLRDGKDITATNDTIIIDEGGKYQFWVSTGSCADTSEVLEITRAPAVKFTVAFENDSAFCEGGSINLVASGDADLKVKWYRDGNQHSSSLKTATLLAGDFYAIGKNGFGCADTSKTLTVTVYETPKPKVELREDTLWCTIEAKSYQWFFKGVEMAGETNQYTVPDEEGAYRVDVESDEGCEAESNGFKYEIIGIYDLAQKFEIKAFPNPFFQSTQIGYTLQGEKNVLIEVYDMQGQKVAGLVDEIQTAGEHQVTFNSQISGIYLMRISIEGEVTEMRLINLARGW